MTYEIIRVSDDDDGQRLDRLLRRLRPDLPFVLVQKLLRKGQIRVDGKRADGEDRVKAGTEIRLPPRETKIREKPAANRRDAAWLRQFILYEDDHILALNKPPGLSVQGGSGLAFHLEMLLPDFSLHGVRPRLVHRLDRETSGVMIIARRSSSARDLTAQFSDRSVQKTYFALVSPVPPKESGRIDARLSKTQSGKDIEKIRVTRTGQTAVTNYHVIEQNKEGTAALVAFYPHTGRTHQIRVHAAHMGAPLIGDPKYGGDVDMMKRAKVPVRVLLHAAAISFVHPEDGRKVVFTAPLPQDMLTFMTKIGLPEKIKVEKWTQMPKD